MANSQLKMMQIIVAAKELREMQKINEIFKSSKRRLAMLKAEFKLDMLIAEFEPELMRFKPTVSAMDIIDYDERS